MGEWVDWHTGYAPGTPLSRRLAVVQGLIRTALDSRAPEPIRVISLCAGDGRDLLGAITDHPRRLDVIARLVELDPELASRARARAAEVSPAVEVVTGDASITTAFAAPSPPTSCWSAASSATSPIRTSTGQSINCRRSALQARR